MAGEIALLAGCAHARIAHLGIRRIGHRGLIEAALDGGGRRKLTRALREVLLSRTTGAIGSPTPTAPATTTPTPTRLPIRTKLARPALRRSVHAPIERLLLEPAIRVRLILILPLAPRIRGVLRRGLLIRGHISPRARLGVSGCAGDVDVLVIRGLVRAVGAATATATPATPTPATRSAIVHRTRRPVLGLALGLAM